MSEQLGFEIVSPERLLKDATAALVVLPGSEGDVGVLVNHAPFMSTLRPGVIEIYETDGGTAERLFVKGGLAHVAEGGGLTILAEEAIDLGTVDRADLAQKVANTNEDLRDASDDAAKARLEGELKWMTALEDALN